jgi:acetylornithine deacetylase
MRPSPETVEILRDLVAFDTTSRNSNRPLLDYVCAVLRKHGIEPHLVWTPDGEKANLWATIGPVGKPGVILSGHTDVVPVDGQEWTSDPFILREEDGRLYGRGACDMKGFLAVVLSLLPEMARAPLDSPIHIAFSHDEEIGCIGVRSLIDWLKDQPMRDRLCIVGEPTDMKPVIGHKGGRAYRVTVTGSEAHSSLAPQAANAIDAAAEMIVFLRGLGNEMGAGPTDEAYDVPFGTLTCGMIRGGTAINIVPKHCEFVFEFRHLAGYDAERLIERAMGFAAEVEGRMRSIAPEASILFEPIYAYPPLAIAPDHEAVQAVKVLASRNDDGKVAYGTEAGFFMNELGVPTVVCGPGSIVQAHRPDEYVALEQLALCETMLRRLIADLTL